MLTSVRVCVQAQGWQNRGRHQAGTLSGADRPASPAGALHEVTGQ